jgi:glycosyltransferase involved in cell wall biosynthesis
MTHFSIIIPCFDAQATLPETLDAILAQAHQDWEVLCIDDGSSDGTRAIIDGYVAKDRRFHLGFSDRQGPSAARNQGALGWAMGDVIAFCDADDIWSTTKLAELATCFTDTTVGAVYGQIAFFNTDPADISTVSTVPRGDLTIDMLLAENPVCTMSNVAVRAAAFRRTGGFDETMVYNEDLDWLIRLVGRGARVVGMDCLHTYYRASAGGLSSDLTAMLNGRRAAVRTAQTYGAQPTADADAVYYRYLARRALRLGHGRFSALRFAARGLLASPAGFFNSPTRGALTLLGAMTAPFLPATLARSLFA